LLGIERIGDCVGHQSCAGTLLARLHVFALICA
jgi:hypothetical protein